MAKRNVVYEKNSFEISYQFKNHQSQKNIIFLHGWGSNKELMEIAFKDCFKDYNHYYIDLPGFGNSPNEKVITSPQYAKIMDLFFKSLNITPDIIVGHSFGGKVALLCENDEIILLSSAGILKKKSFKTKLKILLAKTFKFLHIKTRIFRSADADNLNDAMYEVFKKVVAEDFAPLFKKCNKKATIFWGEADEATPLSSGEAISKLIANNRFFPLEGDHYFFLKKGKIIEEKYRGKIQ